MRPEEGFCRESGEPLNAVLPAGYRSHRAGNAKDDSITGSPSVGNVSVRRTSRFSVTQTPRHQPLHIATRSLAGLRNTLNLFLPNRKQPTSRGGSRLRWNARIADEAIARRVTNGRSTRADIPCYLEGDTPMKRFLMLLSRLACSLSFPA